MSLFSSPKLTFCSESVFPKIIDDSIARFVSQGDLPALDAITSALNENEFEFKLKLFKASYHRLIIFWANQRDFPKAYACFSSMLKAGLSSSNTVYRWLIDACDDDADTALKFFSVFSKERQPSLGVFVLPFQ